MSAMKVTAALVTAFADNGRPIYLYKGDVVPEGITEDSLKNLKDLGFVAEDDETVDDGSESKPAAKKAASSNK